MIKCLSHLDISERKKRTSSTNAAKKRKEVEVILIGRRFSKRREIGPPDEQRPQGKQREGGFYDSCVLV